MNEKIKFIGKFVGFIFTVDGKMHEVSLNGVGSIRIVMEPDILVEEYLSWEDFETKNPEFAIAMKQAIKEDLERTYSMFNRIQYEQAMPEVMPVPTKIKDDDCMYYRDYQ